MKQQTLTGFEKYEKTTHRAQFLTDMHRVIPAAEGEKPDQISRAREGRAHDRCDQARVPMWVAPRVRPVQGRAGVVSQPRSDELGSTTVQTKSVSKPIGAAFRVRRPRTRSQHLPPPPASTSSPPSRWEQSTHSISVNSFRLTRDTYRSLDGRSNLDAGSYAC